MTQIKTDAVEQTTTLDISVKGTKQWHVLGQATSTVYIIYLLNFKKKKRGLRKKKG